jgi:hypothetical protein
VSLESGALGCGYNWENYFVRTLTEDEFRQEAEPMLKKVFADYGDDPIDQSFAPDITERRLIYPAGDVLDKAIPVKVLVAAATAVGDEGCYITAVWKSEDGPNHCFVPLSEMLIAYKENRNDDDDNSEYLELGFTMDTCVLENVIYSPQGKWGLKMTHERYGLLGGVPEFMAIIESGVPNLSQQVDDFFERYRHWGSGKPHLHWLPPLLTHIYGPERAEALVAASQLDMTPPEYPTQAPRLLTEAELSAARAVAAQTIMDLLQSGPPIPRPEH